MMDVIKITSNKSDIILDFFAGSGTTAQAVLDLNKEDGGNRKFIICEQMDYVETVTKERIKKVIEKNGGGSFIYLQLMEYNEAYSNHIRKAKTTKELLAIWEEMQEKAFISYKIDPKTINANPRLKPSGTGISEFESLSFDEQKRFLIEILDKNQLYVNYSEIDDEDYDVTDTDKKLNRQFYGEA
jgi:adenine-specific DNA-methyltransferase